MIPEELKVTILTGEHKGKDAVIKEYTNNPYEQGNHYLLQIEGKDIQNGMYPSFAENQVQHHNESSIYYWN